MAFLGFASEKNLIKSGLNMTYIMDFNYYFKNF